MTAVIQGSFGVDNFENDGIITVDRLSSSGEIVGSMLSFLMGVAIQCEATTSVNRHATIIAC
jgi:hypothetical protein